MAGTQASLTEFLFLHNETNVSQKEGLKIMIIFYLNVQVLILIVEMKFELFGRTLYKRADCDCTDGGCRRVRFRALL